MDEWVKKDSVLVGTIKRLSITKSFFYWEKFCKNYMYTAPEP